MNPLPLSERLQGLFSAGVIRPEPEGFEQLFPGLGVLAFFEVPHARGKVPVALLPQFPVQPGVKSCGLRIVRIHRQGQFQLPHGLNEVPAFFLVAGFAQESVHQFPFRPQDIAPEVQRGARGAPGQGKHRKGGCGQSAQHHLAAPSRQNLSRVLTQDRKSRMSWVRTMFRLSTRGWAKNALKPLSTVTASW